MNVVPSPVAAVLLASSLLAPFARAEGEPQNLRALRHDLAVAEQKLEQARIDMQAQELSAQAGIEQAGTELDLAKARLANFVELDAVQRRTKAELELQQLNDRATEAADELKQIEIMYREQDLNDLTAEFVVSRGRRNAERAAARIALQEQELSALVGRVLPLEERQLALEVDKKRVALEKAKLEARSSSLGRRIGLMKAEEEIVRLREKIEQGEKEAAVQQALLAPAKEPVKAAEVQEW